MNARDELTKKIAELGIGSEFQSVSLHRHSSILQNISSQFTTLNQRASKIRWWWEYLQEPVVSLQTYDPVQTLGLLISPTEQVWFLAEDWSNTKKEGQFWLYESTIGPIAKLVNESRSFEFYVVSKKYSWLVCVNHHQYLIASGQEMVSRIETLNQ